MLKPNPFLWLCLSLCVACVLSRPRFAPPLPAGAVAVRRGGNVQGCGACSPHRRAHKRDAFTHVDLHLIVATTWTCRARANNSPPASECGNGSSARRGGRCEAAPGLRGVHYSFLCRWRTIGDRRVRGRAPHCLQCVLGCHSARARSSWRRSSQTHCRSMQKGGAFACERASLQHPAPTS